jgi:hypothetical protein
MSYYVAYVHIGATVQQQPCDIKAHILTLGVMERGYSAHSHSGNSYWGLDEARSTYKEA